MGLNNMDRYSLSDAYAYIVCGSSAFTTDVIPDNLNPGWLPKTRRACILPLRNAYSQVFVGTFDYDGEKSGDDFLGRVVVDIPQLRPGLVYDVTLPLRQTSRVYNREKLGEQSPVDESFMQLGLRRVYSDFLAIESVFSIVKGAFV